MTKSINEALPPLVLSYDINNIDVKAKKAATINAELTDDPNNPIYFVSSSGNNKHLMGYKDSATGLFVTDTSLNDKRLDGIKLPYTTAIGSLRYRLHNEALGVIEAEMKTLRELYKKNKKAYAEQYKDPDQIEAELMKYIRSSSTFMPNIYKQLRAMPDNKLPQLNEYIAYSDDSLADKNVTEQLDFKNPVNQKLTQEQKDLVEKFLSVFFDEDNLSTFSWYMGAVFANCEIEDDRISRYLLLYSKSGGVGKSTIMNIMGDALLTSTYYSTVPEYDRYFVNGDRFSAAELPLKRLVIYDEAVFNGPTDHENMHNFKGLNENAIKTFATSGKLNTEGKFKALGVTKYHNMHVILTNFVPNVPEYRKDISRRFIDCQLIPTSMVTKSRQLQGMTTPQMIEYVHKHGQAFINYFYNKFKSNTHQFEDYVYSVLDTQDEQDNAIENIKDIDKINIKGKSAADIIVDIAKITGDDPNKLLDECIRYQPTLEYVKKSTTNNVKFTDKEQPNLHYEVNKKTGEITLYINSTKKTFIDYGLSLEFRQQLMNVIPVIRKFQQRVIPLPIKIK